MRRWPVPPWTLVVGAAVWIPLIFKAIRKLDKGAGNDFTLLLAAAHDLFDTGRLYYEGSSYMYPPLFAVLLAAVAWLPDMLVGVAWSLVKVPLFYYSAAVLVPRGVLDDALRVRLIALSPLLVYRFLDSDMATGNTNVMLLSGVAAALHLGSRGSAFGCGALLALVGAVKLSPAYLLAVVGAAGRLRAFASGVALLALLLVVPCFLLDGGPLGALRGFRATNAQVFVPGTTGDDGGGYLPGQSMRVFLHRHLRPIDATAHDKRRIVTINLVSWDATTVEWLYRVSALGMAALGLVAARGRGLRWSVSWGAVLLLLITPYSRKAHFLLLLPALLLCVEVLLAGRILGLSRRAVMACLASSIILAQLTAPAIWGKATAALLTGHCVVGLAALVILPAMWIIRSHE